MTKFDFGSANAKQRKAIETTEGPLLITAGPGTGKTFTLVKRVAYLILEKGVSPENILVATFTEKAARELVTRISNELAASGVSLDVNEMYVGTFHSICLRLIKEHVEYSSLRKSYRVADAFDQQYLVFQNIGHIRCLNHFDDFPAQNGAWRLAGQICSVVNTATEEMLDINRMAMSKEPYPVAVAEIVKEYQGLLAEYNWLDFAHIQFEALRLIDLHPEVRASVNERIRYVMIDEYQDTNYIQEQLVLRLGGQAMNVCVVGDDDQGLYRFRGATIRNILEFPETFGHGNCERVDLTENYRSDPGIVSFYNDWMERTSGPRFRFNWAGYRFEKTIHAARKAIEGAPTVVKVVDDGDEGWCDRLCDLVVALRKCGAIEDYNQVAFLFRSVKHRNARDLAERFEERGINVYSPRSDSFFDRDEVKLAIGCLLLLFPQFVRSMEKGDFRYGDEALLRYFVDCIMCTNELLSRTENARLRTWIATMGRSHTSMKKNTDYAFSGLVYQLFEFDPFKSILDAPIDTGVHDQRALRNLSTLVGITSKFEYLHRVDIFTAERLNRTLDRFFNMYLRFLRQGGIHEYEDEEEYVPSGCVPFLTIHQSKGMEFPIVVVDSLYATPTKSYDEALEDIKTRFGNREPYEPIESVKYFDFWRLYYTAFSRAQDLLVLTHREGTRKIGKAFEEPYGELPDIDPAAFPFEAFSFHRVKENELKPTFSFTSDISLYEGCAVQYKFFRELGFSPVRVGATAFGQLVHQTIEDVHRAALRGEENTITIKNAENWLSANYEAISASQHVYLSDAVLKAAKRQVRRYIERRHDHWGDILEAEVEIGLAKPDYIIHGTVDLVQGEGDSIDIVDFKSERKPDVNRDYELLETYRKQLHLYAHLIEERTGKPVGKMRLYYTGEESGNPEITFNHDRRSIEAVAAEFDDVAHKIIRKDFTCRAANAHLCENCDFRYYCKN